jgi:predicted nucleotidyltransferase
VDSAAAIPEAEELRATGRTGMEQILSELVEKLKRAHKDRLVSVVLYGSAAVPESKDRLSDFNVLCVLKQITPDELAEAEPVFRWWRDMKNPSPLLLSEWEVQTATDCFPIEFHDIKSRHRILYGPDVVTGIEVDDSFYRAEVEHELRAKLLRLRQKAGGVLSDKELLLRLMVESLSTFCVLFRHAIRLGGGPEHYEKREVIEAAQRHFGLEPASLLTILNVREGRAKAREVQPAALFREYLRQIQVVVDAVDQMEK